MAQIVSSQLPAIGEIYALFEQGPRRRISNEEKELRKRIPMPADPELDGLREREKRLLEASQSDRSEDELKSQGYQAQQITVLIPQGTNQTYNLWEANDKQYRMIVDLANWKWQKYILPSRSNVHAWPIDTIKTCASAVTKQDNTFVQDNVGMVYLGLESREGVVSLDCHDVSSPSVVTDPRQPLHRRCSSRKAVKGYVADRFRLRIAHDYVEVIRSHVAPEQCAEKPPYTWEKEYFTEKEPETDLEWKLRKFIEAIASRASQGTGCPPMADLRHLYKAVRDYVRLPEVVARGVQRETLTGWETSEQNNPEGPLNAAARTSIAGLVLSGRLKLLRENGVEAFLASYDPERMSPDSARRFTVHKKDIFFRNIHLNVQTFYTLDEVVAWLKSHRQSRAPQELISAAEKGMSQHQDSYLSAAQGGSGSHSGGLDQETRIRGWREKQGEIKRTIKSQEAQELIKKIAEAAKSRYSELQFRNEELRIIGCGLKKASLDAFEEEMRSGSQSLGENARLTYQVLVWARQHKVPCFLHLGQ